LEGGHRGTLEGGGPRISAAPVAESGRGDGVCKGKVCNYYLYCKYKCVIVYFYL